MKHHKFLNWRYFNIFLQCIPFTISHKYVTS